jgi:hypothetical protein
MVFSDGGAARFWPRAVAGANIRATAIGVAASAIVVIFFLGFSIFFFLFRAL